MRKASDKIDTPGEQPKSARRFLWIFTLIVLTTALLVASVNLIAYRYMLRAENQDIVQLLAGWGRMYKPILYDEIKPEVAVFGASWARDAFDPIETSRLLGKTVFNHAVSGCTGYEARRFADSALDNPNLKAAIVNLDSFYRDQLVARTRYGFDESILDVDPEGRPNYWATLKRNYSLALAGWAAGANIKLISTILARDGGASPSEYLEAYERANHTRRQGTLTAVKQRIFPENASAIDHSTQQPPIQAVDGESVELDLMIDGFCNNAVDVYAYFTPSHTRGMTCDVHASEKIAVLEFLRRKQRSCKSKIHYYDFYYANAVTLEGVLSPVVASDYYRPDGHPRPTMGLLMAARMFDHDFPAGTPAAIVDDFGVDLLNHPQAIDWLREKAARCEGDWGNQGYSAFVEAMSGD